MYLIQASSSGQLPFIPTTLPPGLYEMASDQTLLGSTVASHTTGNSDSFLRGMPGSFPQTSGSGTVAQNQTGSSAKKALASAPFSAFTAPQSQLAWDVTPTEKASADRLFDGLDTRKRGYIESEVVKPYILQSKLPDTDLAFIWSALSIHFSSPTSHTHAQGFSRPQQ